MTTSASPSSFLSASCNTARHLGATLNDWAARSRQRVQIEKELALLNWMHSEIDLIEADLPSKRTTAANSSDC